MQQDGKSNNVAQDDEQHVESKILYWYFKDNKHIDFYLYCYLLMNFVRNVSWECSGKARERSDLTRDNKIFLKYSNEQIWTFWVNVKICILLRLCLRLMYTATSLLIKQIREEFRIWLRLMYTATSLSIEQCSRDWYLFLLYMNFYTQSYHYIFN